MLEKPDLPDERLASALEDHYGLAAVQITFLPLGADRHTAVYRVDDADGRVYFLKLRFGSFRQITVALPRYLADHGVGYVIPPVATRTGRLWASIGRFTLIVYPYVQGQNGYDAALSPQHWHELGRALKSIHSAQVPPSLAGLIRRERYAPGSRQALKGLLADMGHVSPADPVAAQLVTFLKSKREEVLDLVRRAERLAQELERRSQRACLCHSDFHAGNALVDPGGKVYIVDWDDPILAPKERDLMFIGAGHWGDGYKPQEEETLFYGGYGETRIDQVALAYYRYERIVEDIAVFCDRILSQDEGREDRELCLRYLESSFHPGSTVEIAHSSDRTLMES